MRRSALLLSWMVFGEFAMAEDSTTVLVSDGSSQKPHCSWAKQCTWNSATQGACADKLCQSSGFTGGIFDSASGNMCVEGFTEEDGHFWIADEDRLFFGAPKMEARITATCYSGDPPASTQAATSTTADATTASTTQQVNGDNVPDSSTSEAPSTESSSSMPTSSPSTAMSSTAMSSIATSSTATSSTATSSTATSSTATATTTTVSTTSTPPRPIVGEVLGEMRMTYTAYERVCGSPVVATAICKALLYNYLGSNFQETPCFPGCEALPGRLLAEKGLQDNHDHQDRRLREAMKGSTLITYTLTVGPGKFDTGKLAMINSIPLAELTPAINQHIGSYFSNFWVIDSVFGHKAWVAGPTTTATITTTTTVPPFCAGEPAVLNAEDVSSCANLANGASCQPVCKPGYEMQQPITCERGSFNIPGECLHASASTRTTQAIQLSLSLGNLIGAPPAGADSRPPLSLDWAEQNRPSIISAVGSSLGKPPGDISVVFSSAKASSSDGNIRRLADGSGEDEVLEMRVTVLMDNADGTADLGAIAKQYQEQLVKGTVASGGAGSFLGALEVELKTAGAPLPQGFAVAAYGEPAVIQQYRVAVVEWLIGSWSACSSTCGTGSQTREVQCSAAVDSACLGEKPESEKECEDRAGCPFDIGCPFGQDNGMDCGAQLGLVLGSLAAVGTCCLAVLCRRLQVARRPHKNGTVTLPAGLKSTYSIYRPEDASPKGPSQIAAQDGPEVATGDGKTHVVWKTDKAELKEMFAQRGTQLTFTAKASEDASPEKSGRPGMPRIAGASRTDLEALDCEFEACLEEVAAFVDDLGDELDELGEITNPWGASRVAEASGNGLLPAYLDSERVEYYSSSLNRWLAARVNLAVGSSSSVVRYDVTISASQQHRVDVSLEDLRRPLRRGEAVEMFSKRAGAWVPVAIAANQASNATNFGYAVELPDGEGQDKVPAARLRRRYIVGDKVKAYRGSSVGWVAGRVVAVSDLEGDSNDGGGEVMEDGASGGEPQSPARSPESLDGEAADEKAYHRNASAATQGSRASALRQWCLLQVEFEAEGGQADSECFPTYLIR